MVLLTTKQNEPKTKTPNSTFLGVELGANTTSY